MLNPNFPVTLRHMRKAQQLSQLELSLRLGVSQRHVSFVESGRAKPSRELLMAWLQVLDAPRGVCNETLIQAGYAPAHHAVRLDDPALVQVNAALQRLLDVHDPMPALVIDADWNVLRFNRGSQWLMTTLAPWIADWPETIPVNLLDVLISPQGFVPSIVNLHEVGPPFLAQLQYEASTQPRLMPKVEALVELLSAHLGQHHLQNHGASSTAPVLTTRYATQYGELAFFSMFTTFGTPQDITLASLRVEHLFAADPVTHALLQAHVP